MIDGRYLPRSSKENFLQYKSLYSTKCYFRVKGVIGMNTSKLMKILAVLLYFVLIIVSILWFEFLMLLVILITILAIYIYFSNYLALRQRHYQQNKIGHQEEFAESQKWDEHVAKTAIRRSKGV